MAKSRRLGRLLQALQGQQNSSSGFGTGSERSGQHAPRNLRALSKRLTAGFRSTLGRKTPLRHSDMPESPPTGYGDDPLTMEDAQETSRPDHANQGHPRPLSPGQRIQKRSAEHGRESEHDTAVPPGVSCVSTTEEIINWVHQRSIPGDEAPPPDTLPSLQSNALPKGDDHVNQCESSSPEHSRTASVARPVQARGSQKKKSRARESRPAPMSDQEIFESKRRRIYAFRVPSPVAMSHDFSFSMGDSDAIAGTEPGAASKKRWSSSTISTTLTSTPSSESLRGHNKRRPPNFLTPARSSITAQIPYRPGSIPSACSSAHSLTSHEPPLKTVPTSSRHIEKPQLCLSPSSNTRNLSVINERPSSRVCSAKPAPSSLTVDHRSVSHGPSSNSCDLDTEECESRTSANSQTLPSSRGTSPLGSNTPATSRGNVAQLGHPTRDVSDNDDDMSDVTDHTELSLIEAFEASPTPFDPMLLSALMLLKEEAVGRIQQRLQMTTLPAHGTWQHPAEPIDAGSSSSSGTPIGCTHRTSPGRSSLTGLKRPLDDGDDDAPGRGDGGDDERRKRKETASGTQVDKSLKKLACPFYKRYPNSENLPKACHGPGWQSVHRVKEHIYRRHQRPTYRCTRCLVCFENEERLVEHTRAETRCENKTASPGEETIYISQSQERELRRRHRDVPEEERWINVFRIIFPAVPADQTPSPYHEVDPKGLSPDLATLDEFRAFLVRELPSRIADDVNNHLRVQPDCVVIPGDMGGILRDTIREVMEEFLPSLESQHRHERQISDASSVTVGGDHGETGSMLTAFPPVDESCVYATPWPMVASPPSSWQLSSYCSPPAPLAFDFGLDAQFSALDGLAGTQVQTDAATATDAVPASWSLGGEVATGYPFSWSPVAEDR